MIITEAGFYKNSESEVYEVIGPSSDGNFYLLSKNNTISAVKINQDTNALIEKVLPKKKFATYVFKMKLDDNYTIFSGDTLEGTIRLRDYYIKQSFYTDIGEIQTFEWEE